MNESILVFIESKEGDGIIHYGVYVKGQEAPMCDVIRLTLGSPTPAGRIDLPVRIEPVVVTPSGTFGELFRGVYGVSKNPPLTPCEHAKYASSGPEKIWGAKNFFCLSQGHYYFS